MTGARDSKVGSDKTPSAPGTPERRGTAPSPAPAARRSRSTGDEDILFSWIHLADLQVGQADGAPPVGRKRLLDALARDVAEAHERGECPPPDAIFVTGDLAFSGQQGEYLLARDWLARVAGAVGLDLGRVFSVPGNHDVDRAADKEMLTDMLVGAVRAGIRTLDDVLHDARARPFLAGRMVAYSAFARALGPAVDSAPGEERLFWDHSEVVRGTKVRVVGLNTALLATGNGDKGKLALGESQLQLLRSSKGELTIVLSHHPFQWLSDGAVVAAQAGQSADVHLSGHVHEAEAMIQWGGGGTGIVRVQAGTAHFEKQGGGEPEGLGYNWASVVRTADGRVVLRVWPWRWTPAHDFRIDIAHVPKGKMFAEQVLLRLGAQAGSSAQVRRESAAAHASVTVVQHTERLHEGVNIGYVDGNVTIGEDRSARDAEALHAYRRWVAAGCERLAMRLLAPEQNDASRSDETPELARVYIELDTTATEERLEKRKPRRGQGPPEESDLLTAREEIPRQLSVLEVMAKEPRLVLLGHPGFGKSTLVQHTALCLARDAAAPEGGWDKLVPGLGCRGAEMLPVVVVLRDLAASLPQRTEGVEANSGEPGKPGKSRKTRRPDQAEKASVASGEVLRRFLESRLRDAGLVDAIEPFWKTLSAGKALVLLDGLDEVPTPEGRQFLRDVVMAFEQLYPKCRYVVTCRVLTWAQEKMSLRDFAVTEIAPFDEAKIHKFIDAWHGELVRLGRVDAGTAADLSPRLWDAIRERPGLAALAQTPLLLTVMAVVHTKEGQLPEGEALLYREAVEVLLWRWQGTVSAQSPTKLLKEVGARDSDLLDALRRLAFMVHGKTPAGDGADDGVADIAETELLDALMTLDPNESKKWARRLVDALKTRAGLLLERAPQLYTFPHRTFQELLAGWHLSLQRDFEVQAARLLREDATRWRKAVLLATGLLAAEPRLGELKALLDELCPPAGEDKDTEAAWREAWWAGEVLEVVGARRLGRSRAEMALVERVRGRLCALVERGKLAPRERVEAGRVLGRLGDPRFQEDAWRLPAGEMGGFVQIPAGPFWMGSDKTVDKEAYDNELPGHEVTIPEVWMARYPVTVAQWRAFVRASGFKPGDEDSLKGVDNEPVRWVSWHEAMAYTGWLDGELRASSDCPPGLKRLLDAGHHVKLPSEAEWEKAARGTGGRLWPWGGTFEKERLNGFELRLNGVSAVGCFPTGATPEGLQDMAGNVWEWTRSVYAPYPYLSDDGRESDNRQESGRVLRGGSFDYVRLDVRCAYRLAAGPGNRLDDVGFRLLLSPF